MTPDKRVDEAAEAEYAKRKVMRKVWTWPEGFKAGVAWRDENPKDDDLTLAYMVGHEKGKSVHDPRVERLVEALIMSKEADAGKVHYIQFQVRRDALLKEFEEKR